MPAFRHVFADPVTYRFYDFSAVRTAGLRGIQEVLNDPQLKLTKASNAHWLSHERAADNLRKCLPSVITSLEREASKRHDAQALGLARFVQSYKFVATLLMLSDILPPLANLSRAFHRKDLDYTLVNPLVAGTRGTLQDLMASPGQYFATLNQFLNSNLESFNIEVPAVNTFRATIYSKYLDVVDNHLARHFPDIELLEAFSVFDRKKWPDSLQLFGVEHLITLADHFTPAIINSDEIRTEWELFKNSGTTSDSLQ